MRSNNFLFRGAVLTCQNRPASRTPRVPGSVPTQAPPRGAPPTFGVRAAPRAAPASAPRGRSVSPPRPSRPGQASRRTPAPRAVKRPVTPNGRLRVNFCLWAAASMMAGAGGGGGGGRFVYLQPGPPPAAAAASLERGAAISGPPAALLFLARGRGHTHAPAGTAQVPSG